VSPSRSGNDCYAFDPIAIQVHEPSQVGEARRFAAAMSRLLVFDDTISGKAALVVTEVASNIVKHGGGGVLLLSPLERAGITGLEILALDKGPGMENLATCCRDGFSTAGSPGTGFGAIARSADFLTVYTLPRRVGGLAGTALLARLWARPTSRGRDALELGAVWLPKLLEPVCGDGWALHEEPGRVLVMVADGLGHGSMAASASREAVRVLRERSQLGPAELIHAIHAALRSTRGAAIAVAAIDLQARTLHFAGVGNISGTIVTGETSRSVVSHNGTVGHEMRKVQEFSYPFPSLALLVMHSDGLATHWDLEQYPGLALREPALIAGVLYRDHQRGRDDVTVLALREAPE
jgi:anti-sigma regulatory factor (Ser/Thr protein kinase)